MGWVVNYTTPRRIARADGSFWSRRNRLKKRDSSTSPLLALFAGLFTRKRKAAPATETTTATSVEGKR